MKALPLTLAAAGVVTIASIALRAKASAVEALSPIMKKVTVNGRSYIVTRLGAGKYWVARTDSVTSLTFDQKSVTAKVGNASDLALLDSDMRQFPSNLFAE